MKKTTSGLTAALGPRPTSFVDHELSVNIVEHDGELIIDFEYNRDLFEPATVARMVGHFTTLLAAISRQPEQPALALPLLTVAERQQLLCQHRDALQQRLAEEQAHLQALENKLAHYQQQLQQRHEKSA